MDATLLALDTSTDQLALALIWPGGQLAHVEGGGALASTRLIPAMVELLCRAGLNMKQLTGIAFGAGPGAFTGLRTACSVAQGLAFGLGLRLLALDSLMLVAEDAHAQADAATDAATDANLAGPIWVAMDARMDEIYAAAYERQAGGQWRVLSAPGLYAWQTLADRWLEAPPTWVAGSALAAFAGRLPVAVARCTPREQDRAAALGRLARAQWADEQAVDPALALPLYLRDKVAQTTAERLRAKAAT